MLDLAAAAWSIHNGDMTGHGTEIMPAADWTFLPLAPHNRGDGNLAALARPDTGNTRSDEELARLQQLALLLGQAVGRVTLEQERRERERLEDADRLRRTMLASLAHDFRTPLTVIAGQLEAMAGYGPEAVGSLSRRAAIGQDDGGFDRSGQGESGLVVEMHQNLDVVDVVSVACDAITPATGISVNRSIPADLPFIRGDPALLHHVLVNLLDNAAIHAKSSSR